MVRHLSTIVAAALVATTTAAFAQTDALRETQAFVENGIHVILAPASNQIVSVIIEALACGLPAIYADSVLTGVASYELVAPDETATEDDE